MSIPAPLRPYVASLQVYDVAFAHGPGVHIGMPSTTVTFVLPLAEPLDVAWVDDPSSRGRTWASVSGIHGRPAAIHHGARQRGMQLALTTAGARALLGVPARELAGELLELGEVDPGMADLPERLAGAPAEDRVEVVFRALTAAMQRHDAPGPRADVGRALALLTRGARVAAVAADVGYSRRRLTTLVRDEVGVTPQDFHRLGRFERSHTLMRRRSLSGRVSIADVAAECGYADHSHLTREWVEFAGCTPTAWQRKEFPILQAGTDADGAE